MLPYSCRPSCRPTLTALLATLLTTLLAALLTTLLATLLLRLTCYPTRRVLFAALAIAFIPVLGLRLPPRISIIRQRTFIALSFNSTSMLNWES